MDFDIFFHGIKLRDFSFIVPQLSNRICSLVDIDIFVPNIIMNIMGKDYRLSLVNKEGFCYN